MKSRNSVIGVLFLCATITGCRSTREWRNDADKTADYLIDKAQKETLHKAEPIQIETAADTLRRRLMIDQNLPHKDAASLGIRDLKETTLWHGEQHLKEGESYDGAWNTTDVLRPTLLEAIQIAAKCNRDFISQKEQLYQVALTVDLAAVGLRTSIAANGSLQSSDSGNGRKTGSLAEVKPGMTHTFNNAISLVNSLTVDLAKMLSRDHGASFGIGYDGSITVPLLRGSGRLIGRESLTQAERNLVYQVREFEQYKRRFVVTIANSYLNVLRTAQTLKNQEESYKRIVTTTRRTRRMADAGLMTEYQFDQSVQSELTARESWISAQQSLAKAQESFRVLLGLSPDSAVEPREEELIALQEQLSHFRDDGGDDAYSGNIPSADAPVELKMPSRESIGPNEIQYDKALQLAFEHRPDFQNSLEKVEDAQRAVLIAEDGLRAEFTIGGSGSIGEGRGVMSGDQPDGTFRASRGTYGGWLHIDLPIERTSERNQYRNSMINLERVVRSFQAAEDQLKQDVVNTLRNLLENRERLVIQMQAVKLAERRVASTDMLLQAGRAELRDVLEAQNALTTAQNSLYSAMVSYRINELEMQRDLGVLNVTEDGVWSEVDLREYR